MKRLRTALKCIQFLLEMAHPSWPCIKDGHCPSQGTATARSFCLVMARHGQRHCAVLSQWYQCRINTDGQLLPPIVGNSFIPLLAASSCRLKSRVSDQNIVRMWQVQCMLLASVKKSNIHIHVCKSKKEE